MTLYGSNVGLFANGDLVTLSNQKSGLELRSNATRLYGLDATFILDANTISLSNNSGRVMLSSNDLMIGGTNGNIELSSNNIFIGFDPTTKFSLTNRSMYLGGSQVDTSHIVTKQSSIKMMNSMIDITNSNARISMSNHNIRHHSESTFTSNVTMLSSIHLSCSNETNRHWSMSLEPKSATCSDLILASRNNTVITFTDDFEPEILNFTGKHRCVFSGNRDNIAGLILSSSGTYTNLFDKPTIAIDEAIPIVELCKTPCDPRVFGVICSQEKQEDTRSFKLGNLQFKHKNTSVFHRVIVNSHGEGGIWVCDAAGSLSNGDLICSSHLPGYGMKQNDDLVRSYTVAKITCDCDFDVKSTIYKCEFVKYQGNFHRRAFVGCVYKI
jgi:hypothetical protein